MTWTQRQEQIDDLVDCWEELRAQGMTISVDELCRGCPDLLVPVREQIAALRWVPPAQSRDGLTDQHTSGETPAAARTLPSHLGRYQLLRMIGAGGFGQVWLAFDPELQRHVAIKVPRPDRVLGPQQVLQFLSEARKVAKLSQAGIVPVHDVGREGSWCYIVSEYIDGSSLAQRLDRERLPWQEAALLVAAVAESLDFAHQQGFIHRDVKPANILLNRDGRPFLTDFGIAVTQSELSEQRTFASGTLRYMSPEQACGSATTFSARSDIFSLGVVLYELLCRRSPYAADTPLDLQREIIETEPVPPRKLAPALPRTMEAACLKALAKEPEQRFATAGQFAASLRSIVAQAAERRRLKVAAVLLALLATSAAVGGWWTLGTPDDGLPTVLGPEDPGAAAVKLTSQRLVPVARYLFDRDSDRLANSGAFGPAFALRAEGSLTYTQTGDRDAPPAGLGRGVRFPGQNGAALSGAPWLLDGPEWTLSWWFRRETEQREAVLLYFGPHKARQDRNGMPEFAILLTAAGKLRIINHTSDLSRDVECDLEVPAGAIRQWRQVALTFVTPGVSTHGVGRMHVYLDGKIVQVIDAISMNNNRTHLLRTLRFGQGRVYRHVPRELTFQGVLADIELFDLTMSKAEVAAVYAAARSGHPHRPAIPTPRATATPPTARLQQKLSARTYLGSIEHGLNSTARLPLRVEAGQEVLVRAAGQWLTAPLEAHPSVSGPERAVFAVGEAGATPLQVIPGASEVRFRVKHAGYLFAGIDDHSTEGNSGELDLQVEVR